MVLYTVHLIFVPLQRVSSYFTALRRSGSKKFDQLFPLLDRSLSATLLDFQFFLFRIRDIEVAKLHDSAFSILRPNMTVLSQLGNNVD